MAKIFNVLSNIVKNDYIQSFNILKTQFEVKAKLSADHSLLGFIFNWLNFDTLFDEKNNGPFLQVYYRKFAKDMNDLEKALCKTLISSRLSIFEVLETLPNTGLTVQDLFTKKKHFIFDQSMSTNVVKWDVFIDRLLTVHDVKFISGYPIVIDLDLAKFLVRKMKLEAKKRSNQSSLPPFQHLASLLKEEQYFLFKIMYQEIRKEIQLLTAELDPVYLITATYEHSNIEVIMEFFKSINEMELYEDFEEKIFYNFVVKGDRNPIIMNENSKSTENAVIYKSDFNLDNTSNELLVLGTIEVTEEKLTVDAFSTRRFEYLEKKILSNLASFIQLEDKYEREPDEKLQRGIRTFHRDTYDRIMHLENFEEIIKKQFKNWATKGIKSFNGLSILEASKMELEKFKYEIIDHLKTIENTFLNLEKYFQIKLDKSDLIIIKDRVGLN